MSTEEKFNIKKTMDKKTRETNRAFMVIFIFLLLATILSVWYYIALLKDQPNF